MSTYSVNIAQSTESTSTPIVTDSDRDYILGKLPDNVTKEVSPRDIRDAIISDWDVPSFKETKTASSISYIGIDAGNPANRDVKLKIYFGKRQLGANENMIMSSSLLSSTQSDTDIFLYNTKKFDTPNLQLKTRVSFLSGVNSVLHNSAPYIQSQIVIGTAGQVLSLDIVNPSSTKGDILLRSDYGVVSVNNVKYPTISQTTASASNLKTLRYDNGQLFWDNISVNFYNSVGATGSPLSIFGTPVSVNGIPIEFTDTRKTPIPFHGVGAGRTFVNSPIVEVLREILYPYLKPLCTLNISQSVTEFGTFPSIKLYYSITKRSFNVNTITLGNMIPSSLPPIISNAHVTVTGTASGVYISNTNTTFQITVSDGTQSNSASQSLRFVYPYFFGLLNAPTINFAGLSTLDKVVSAQSDQTVGLLGSGYIYYIYDNAYPVLNRIIDENSVEIYGTSSSLTSFTYSVVTLTSPSWLWASHQFKVYRSMTSSYSFSPPSANFQFKY